MSAVKGGLELSDGRLLTWSDDATARLWSSEGEEQAVLRGHEGAVLGGLELSDGRLLTWSSDATARLWSAEGEEQAVLRGHEGWVLGRSRAVGRAAADMERGRHRAAVERRGRRPGGAARP